jgi:hypothetical protein
MVNLSKGDDAYEIIKIPISKFFEYLSKQKGKQTMSHKKIYTIPKLSVYGNIEKITLQARGGFNKPFNCGDGMSGTQGNNSCNVGGGGSGGVNFS